MRLCHFPFYDKNIYFCLDEKDPVGLFISEHNIFYDINYLEFLNFLPIDNGVVVDVGAGIGNHALYCGAVLNQKVYVLEENPEYQNLLKTNIFLNGFTDNIKIIPKRLDDKNTKSNAYNLDKHLSGQVVSYLKIHPNFHANEVVVGALDLIQKSKPIICIQYQVAVEYRQVNELLTQFNYQAVHFQGSLGENYAIFLSLDKVTESKFFLLQNAVGKLNLDYGKASVLYSKLSQPKVKAPELNDTDQLDYSIKINDNKIDYLLDRAANKEKELKMNVSIFTDPVAAAEEFFNKVNLLNKNILINLTSYTNIQGDYDHIQYLSNGEFIVNGKSYNNLKIPTPYNTILVRILIQQLRKQNKNIFVLTYADSNLRYAHEFFEQHGVNYGIVLNDIPDIKWAFWSYFTNASFITSLDSELVDRFKKQYIFPVRNVDAVNWNFDQLAQPYKPNIITNNASAIKKRVLLISYYALDMDIVGVMRANYWFKNIPSLSNEQLHIEMVTAVKPHNHYDNVHYVPDFGIESATIIDESEFAKHLQISQYMNTVALSWTKELVKYFDSINAKYDAVIITGNPFFHFEFSKYAKQKWGALIYQDYRDPMAANPRLRGNNQHLRQYHEDYFCSLADKVITVNQWCANHLSLLAPQPIEIIPNGYDDVVDQTEIPTKSNFENKPNSAKMAYLSNAKSSFVKSANSVLGQYEKLRMKPWIKNAKQHIKFLDMTTSDASAAKAKQLVSRIDGLTKLYSKNNRVIRLVYAGTFYEAASPKNLVDAIKAVIGYELHHFGSESKYTKTKNTRIVAHGRVPYAELLNNLEYLDIGVVYVTHDFESTTKIYDYIAKDMPVLVVTSLDNPRPESLYKELNGLEGIYWVVNDKEAITAFLRDYIHRPIQRERRQEYSRKYGTQKLIELILEGEK